MNNDLSHTEMFISYTFHFQRRFCRKKRLIKKKHQKIITKICFTVYQYKTYK